MYGVRIDDGTAHQILFMAYCSLMCSNLEPMIVSQSREGGREEFYDSRRRN